MWQTIRDNINAGKYEPKNPYPTREQNPTYPKGHIFDIKQSVEWNNEQRETFDKQRQYDMFEHRKSRNAAEKLFEDDIANAITTEHGLNDAQGRLIFKYAWDEGHSAGLLEVLQKAQEVTDFVESVINAGGQPA